MSQCSGEYELVMTFVERGAAEQVLKLTKQAGAEGGTVISARGGVNNKEKIFGVTIEPEKDVILTIIPKGKAEAVMKAIHEGMNMCEPGHGITLSFELSQVAGICHTIQP